jgi:hypothetical protein
MSQSLGQPIFPPSPRKTFLGQGAHGRPPLWVRYNDACAARAATILDAAAQRAGDVGVACNVRHVPNSYPADGILEAADASTGRARVSQGLNAVVSILDMNILLSAPNYSKIISVLTKPHDRDRGGRYVAATGRPWRQGKQSIVLQASL